ncbi:MAG: hypothetical protein DRJ41_03430 [Thermoprotei archaeon]|nr:MAG: hypothetical protein DRJ41_03430 [Thermoprotei archaeon]
MRTIKELSKELGIPERTLRYWCQKRIIRAVKVKRAWRIPEKEFERVRKAVELARVYLPIPHVLSWLVLSEKELSELEEEK